MLPALQQALAGAGAAAAAAGDQPGERQRHMQLRPSWKRGRWASAYARTSCWPALLFCALRHAVFTTANPPEPPAAPLRAAAAESESDQALAIGACRVLEGRAVWRHVSRDWGATRALMLALIASGARQPGQRGLPQALCRATCGSGGSKGMPHALRLLTSLGQHPASPPCTALVPSPQPLSVGSPTPNPTRSLRERPALVLCKTSSLRRPAPLPLP